MKTLPRFDETEITVANDVITITQTRSYNRSSISIPVALWETFYYAVMDELPMQALTAMPETVEP